MHTDVKILSIDEIKKGYKDFLCDLTAVQDGCILAKLFLTKVLGYNAENDLIIANVNKHKNTGEAISVMCERPVKFYFEWLRGKIEDSDIKTAAEISLFAHVNVFLITNWKKLLIYDQDEGESTAELVYSIDFTEDEAHDAAAKFWVLSRKDCNKTILVNTKE